MRKKRIILKRSISALVIGAVTISILAGATSASSSVNADDATASVAVFENLLNDRSFVVDTFTQDTMPESNPYGRLDGVANTDYLSTDFLKQYENDPIFKSGVSLYYRMTIQGRQSVRFHRYFWMFLQRMQTGQNSAPVQRAKIMILC